MRRFRLNKTTALSIIWLILTALAIQATAAASAPHPDRDADKNAENSAEIHCEYYQPGEKHLYWGDLHVHTAYSLDAYAFGTLKTPQQAYAFARGEAMILQDGSRAQLDRPLDFAAVTDHAEWFDLLHICTDPEKFDDPYCERLRKDSSMENGSSLFADYVIPTITQESPQATPICLADPAKCERAAKSQWQRVQDQANAANDPCQFTAQIGYEWSYTKSFSHSHRNIIFANGNVTKDAIDYIRHPTLPALWQQLEQQCRPEDDCDVLAIPHNTNMGDGTTFDVETEDDRTLQLRSKYERLVEIHQEKGNSECLSPLKSDESGDCSFENYITNHSRPKAKDQFSDAEWAKMRGTYVRGLLMRGLAAYQNSGKVQRNPLQVGIIGSTDNHAGTPGDEAGLGKEMMLNTDMCLYFTMDDDGLVELDAATAAENDCLCTWAAYFQFQQASDKYMNGTFCGSHDIPGAADFPRQRSICCGEEFDSASDLIVDCGLVIKPLGPAVTPIKKFANDEDKWMNWFLRAWEKATGNGFSLKKLSR